MSSIKIEKPTKSVDINEIRSRKDKVKLFDPEAFAKKAIKADFDSSIVEIDESDVPKAYNVIDWCLGAKYLNSTLFTAQAKVLVQLFADYCPDCTDKKYFDNVPVKDMTGMEEFKDRVKLLKHGVCRSCKKNRLELNDYLLTGVMPQELIAVWGQRSGKSVVAGSKGATYQLHRFLKLPNIAKYFGQDTSTQFDMVFTALTLPQAISSLWSKFYNAYTQAPWFRAYNKFLKEKAKQMGIPPDDLFKVMDTYIEYGGTKNIVCTAKPSDLRSLRGDTRIWGSIDEFGWFGVTGQEVRANANEVYASINNSLTTVRAGARARWQKGDYDAPTAIMANISSPSSNWDASMVKLKEAERDKSKISSHLATWECVTGDTIIVTPDGPCRIDSIATQTGLHPVENLSVMGHIGFDPVTHVFRSPDKRPVVRLTTERGMSLTCTPSHRIRVLDSKYRSEFQEVHFVTPGTIVTTPNVGPNKRHDRVVSVEFLKDPEYVYDLTVEDTHEYESNGFISHNCNPQYVEADFKSMAMLDPIKVARDFGAVPPLAANPFIGSEKNLDRVKSPKLSPVFRYKQIYVNDNASNASRYLGAKIIEPSIVKDKVTPRILCVDAGETGNSFGMVLTSMSREKADNGTMDTHLNVDGVIEVSPERIPGTDEVIPVHFPTMFACIIKLCECFNIQYVLWDRWQSTGEIQRLRDMKIKAEKYSPKFSDFLNLRTMIWGSRVHAPMPEINDLGEFDITNPIQVMNNPITHFYVQMATVREIGNKVAKPMGGEDDMFRCLVLASTYISDPEITKNFAKYMGINSRPGGQNSTRILGTVSGYTSRSGGTGLASSGGVTLGSVKTRTSRLITL